MPRILCQNKVLALTTTTSSQYYFSENLLFSAPIIVQVIAICFVSPVHIQQPLLFNSKILKSSITAPAMSPSKQRGAPIPIVTPDLNRREVPKRHAKTSSKNLLGALRGATLPGAGISNSSPTCVKVVNDQLAMIMRASETSHAVHAFIDLLKIAESVLDSQKGFIPMVPPKRGKSSISDSRNSFMSPRRHGS